MMMNVPAPEPLSDYEQRVYDVLVANRGTAVSYEEICSKTLINPDIVLHVMLALVQKGRATLDPSTKLSDLELLANEGAGV